MENGKLKTPTWFWVVAVFFLLWNIMGVVSFFYHTSLSAEDLALLPDNESALYADFPLWTTTAFALAVFGGMLGAIGLILKKKWSKMAFIVSLLGIIPQMGYNVFFTKSMEVYGPGEALTMPVMVLVIGVFLIWFSNYAIKKEWLN